VINLLIDRITGFDMSKRTTQAISFDFLNRSQIENYQKEKFQELSRIASTSEYYKDYCNKSLEEFPFINRDEYQKNLPLLRTNFKHPFHIKQSSGSTGQPVKQFVTKDMLLAKRSSHQKMLSWYGLTRESPEFKLGGLHFNVKTKIYHFLRNKRHFDSFYISDQTLPGIIRTYNKFKPAILYGYPSTINRFIMFSRNKGFKLFQPDIIVTHAENLYKEIENNIKLVFPGSKIVNQYWSTEANIAEMCPDGKLHVDEDTVICEVINPDKQGIGDLYITNLFSYIVPIIRYRIGDRVKISGEICSCGRSTKIIESIEGREGEYLELPNGIKFPITAMQEIDFAENILYYQLIFYKKDKRIVFKYIPVSKDLPIKKEFIFSHFRDKFGLYTEFEQVTSIESSPGGKLKRLIVIE
jgi:phenylacetate-CoA ligase